MSRIHPERQQLIAASTPAAFAPDAPSQAWTDPSPEDSLPAPPVGSDNGWASRRARSNSHAVNSTAIPSAPASIASASVRRAASNPTSAELCCAENSSTTPSTSVVPWQSMSMDPRPRSQRAPALSPQDIPCNERKLEFLLRTTEQRIVCDRSTSRHWTRLDSDLLQKLIAEHQTLGAGYSMRTRAMDTALSSFIICVDAYRAKRVATEALTTIDGLRKGVQDIVIDLCEDLKTHVRTRAYAALLSMSQTDLTLVKHHTSILVQLLENDGDGELDLVQDILAQHAELSLSDWLQVAIGDGCLGSYRGLVIDFLGSASGGKVLQTILDNGLREAELALHLASALPLADTKQYKSITEILHSLQTIWPEAKEKRSLEEKKAARDAGAAVLWNLCRVLMGQSKTFVSGPPEAPLLTFKTTELLDQMQPQSRSFVIARGPSLFNDMVMLSLGMGVPEHEGAAKLSPAKKFLNELEVSARYFFCLLPPSANDKESDKGSDKRSADTDADTALHHFTSIERIAFFRSAANLAAKVVSAAKESPSDLGYPGESTAREIAQVTTKALMTHVATNSLVIEGRSDAQGNVLQSEAHDAYAMLAAEALLIAVHLCETYLLTIPNGSAMITNDLKVRDRVRALTALAEEVDRTQNSPTEVLEAAKVVRALGNVYFKVRSRTDTHFSPPEWLMPPPPFPTWVKPEPEPETAKKPAASGRKGGRGRKRSDDGDTSQERRVRGRGPVRANADFDADAWDVEASAQLSGLPRSDLGITIRGASQAETGSPKREADAYRPEPSLFARLDRRDDLPGYDGAIAYASHAHVDHYASSSYRPSDLDQPHHAYRYYDDHASSWSFEYESAEPRYHEYRVASHRDYPRH